MNYNDIATMLAAGKSAEDIAKEFTDALNKAQDELKAQKEAEAKKEAESAKMNAVATKIADGLNEYLALAGIETEQVSADEVRTLLDEFLPLFGSLKNFEVKITTPKIPNKDNADKILASWLKNLGW